MCAMLSTGQPDDEGEMTDYNATAAFCLLLPGKTLYLSPLLYLKTFRKKGTRMEWSELLSVEGRGFRNSFGSWGQQRNKHCTFVYIHALCEVLRCFSSMSFKKLVFQKQRRTV